MSQSSRSPRPEVVPENGAAKQRLQISGEIPSELWNRLGTKIIPKLKTGRNLHVTVGFAVEVESCDIQQLIIDLRQTLADLGLADALVIRPI
jgi:hypothetical protein